MALVRGATSNFPCPVCLVPSAELHAGVAHTLRTSENMRQVYNVACEFSTVDERESHLRGYGLRHVEVP